MHLFGCWVSKDSCSHKQKKLKKYLYFLKGFWNLFLEAFLKKGPFCLLNFKWIIQNTKALDRKRVPKGYDNQRIYSVKDTSASRRPIRLSDVVNRSKASDGDEVSIINLSSSSTRKLTLHSWSRLRRISHSWSNFVLAVFTCSLLCFSFW